MSREILHQIPDDEVDEVVNGLEAQTYRLETVGILVMGPFALFPANSPLPETSVNDELSSEIPASLVSQCAANVQGDLSLALDLNMGCATPSFGGPGFFDPLTSFEALLSDVDVDANGDHSISTCLMPVNRLPTNNPSIIPPSPLGLHFTPGGYDSEEPVTPNTHFLLKHYKSVMGKLFSPLRVHKAPWAIIHFPRVLAILSELSLFKKTTHAKSSLFYGILSVSAFNIDKVSLQQTGTSNYWWAVGEHFRDRAKKELGRSCDTELCGEERAKYKDILMAILTMVTISVSHPLCSDSPSLTNLEGMSRLSVVSRKKPGHFC
jgi:arginine metabolism regulation protein II